MLSSLCFEVYEAKRVNCVNHHFYFIYIHIISSITILFVPVPTQQLYINVAFVIALFIISCNINHHC